MIRPLEVHEGSIVKSGQTLMLLRLEQSSAAMGDTGSLVSAQLSAQAQRLDRGMQLAATDAQRQTRATEQELANLHAEKLLIEDQISLRTRQLQQAQSALARIAPLQQSGVLARRQVEEYEQAVLTAEDALNDTRLRRLEQQRRLQEAAMRLNAQPAQAIAHDTQLRGERAVLTQSLAATEAQRMLRVVAPRDGVVSGLAVQLGQSVAAMHRLLTVVPAHSELVAQLWVPSAAAGQLAAGDLVLLRVDAFPYQHHGQVRATIAQIALTTIGPEEIRHVADRAIDYPAYRVIARLPAAPGALPVHASMSLVGDIRLERRSLIAWLYAPLLAAVGAGSS